MFLAAPTLWILFAAPAAPAPPEPKPPEAKTPSPPDAKAPEAPLSAEEFLRKKKELNQSIQDELKAKNLAANDPKSVEVFRAAALRLDALRPELVDNPDGQANPDAMESLAWLVWFWRSSGDAERRRATLERAWGKPNLPPDLRILFGIERAGIRLERGEPAEAAKRIRELWDHEKIPASHQSTRALEGSRLLLAKPSALLEAGKPSEAGASYQAVSALEGLPGELRGMIAIDWADRLGRRKQSGSARRVLDEAWARKDIPVPMRAHIGAARALYALEMNDNPGAEAALKDIESSEEFKARPDARCQGFLIWISGLAHRGRRDEARSALERLLEIHPENLKGPEGFKVLAGVLTVSEMSGAATKGFQCLDAAIAQADREPRERVALEELCAFHLIELGDLAEARKRISRLGADFGKEGKEAAGRLQGKIGDPSYTLLGQAPPPIGASDAAGKAVSWVELKGKPVLLMFWSPDSEMSRRELPVLASIANDLGPRGLHVLAVCLARDRAPAEKFVRDSRLPGRHIFAEPEDSTIKAYRLPGVPQSFLVDRDGVIRRIGLRGDTLRAAAADITGAGEAAAPVPPKDVPAPPKNAAPAPKDAPAPPPAPVPAPPAPK